MLDGCKRSPCLLPSNSLMCILICKVICILLCSTNDDTKEKQSYYGTTHCTVLVVCTCIDLGCNKYGKSLLFMPKHGEQLLHAWGRAPLEGHSTNVKLVRSNSFRTSAAGQKCIPHRRTRSGSAISRSNLWILSAAFATCNSNIDSECCCISSRASHVVVLHFLVRPANHVGRLTSRAG